MRLVVFILGCCCLNHPIFAFLPNQDTTVIIPKQHMNPDCKKCDLRKTHIFQRKSGALWGAGTWLLSNEQKERIKAEIVNSELDCVRCRLRNKGVWISKGNKVVYGQPAAMKYYWKWMGFILGLFKKKIHPYPELFEDPLDKLDSINSEGGYYWNTGKDLIPILSSPKGRVTDYYLESSLVNGVPTTTRHKLTLDAANKLTYQQNALGLDEKQGNPIFKTLLAFPELDTIERESTAKHFKESYNVDIKRLYEPKIKRFYEALSRQGKT